MLAFFYVAMFKIENYLHFSLAENLKRFIEKKIEKWLKKIVYLVHHF